MPQEDEPTLNEAFDLGGFEHGPPTIEERIPDIDASGETPRFPEPQIVPGSAPPPARVPAQIVGAEGVMAPTTEPGWTPPDGPTQPDGLPALGAPDTTVSPVAASPVAASPVAASPVAASPVAVAASPVAGQVPAPNAPSIEISKSLEIAAARLDDQAYVDASRAPAVRAARKKNYLPTEVLPALTKKPPKEDRSEVWLVVGIVGLGLVILALLGALAVGVAGRMNEPDVPDVSAPE